MPKNKELVKVHNRAPRFRENTRLMRVHESVVDLLKGAPPSGSLLDVMAANLFGIDILNVDEDNDLMYSDEDDDEVSSTDPNKHLEPHPRIKQLTDEEAEKQAKELIEEEERKGRKTKKNKHKKMRKKEKKRLEKENAEKNSLPEEEQEKSDSSDSPEENSTLEKKTESKDEASTAVSDKIEIEPGCDDLNKINEEVDEPQKKNEDKVEATENTELNTSYPCNTKSVAEEAHQYTQKTKEEESETVEDEEKTNLTKKSKAGKEEEKSHLIKEMKQDMIKEEPVDPTVLEFAQRSRDLAAAGNRLAAAGQYDMAVNYFTDAIKYNPRETRLFGNRSLCFERMHQYENALSDADIALTMEPNWTKGLFRKGKALCGLKKYYQASLVYKDVLKLESSSKEAMQELKRAQTLHLMEMGFTWAQSCEALKTHATLEEAIDALFCGAGSLACGGTGAGVDSTMEGATQEDRGTEMEWSVQQTTRPRTQYSVESNSQNQPTPMPKSSTKPQLFSVWVGSMAPTVTYTILHEVFSRAGTVCSIKMLLEHKTAFVNYATKKESDRAIQCINGMVVEGMPLLVRYPSRNQTGLGVPKWATGDPSAQSGSGGYKKECFFWRTTGCVRDNCIFRHIPEHKGLDKDKFTSGLGMTFT